MKFRITVEIPDDKVCDLYYALKPFSLNKAVIRNYSTPVTIKFIRQKILGILNVNGELSAKQIFNKYKSKGFCYKTLTRRLIELVIIGKISCKKVSGFNGGGYKNIYKLKELSRL